MPPEQLALSLHHLTNDAKSIGWIKASDCPYSAKHLLLIEPGSTGVHTGSRDENGDFWIHEDGGCPSMPTFVKIVSLK